MLKLIQTVGEMIDPFREPDLHRFDHFAGKSHNPWENVGNTIRGAMDELSAQEPVLRDVGLRPKNATNPATGR